MGYRIIISPRAQQEIIEAIDYYTQKSLLTPSNFIASLDEDLKEFEDLKESRKVGMSSTPFADLKI